MKYLCPQCQAPLREEQQRWHCTNNHSFDKAKQGYCNLLLVQNKRSKAPGDNAEMVQARRRFLSQQFYQSVSTAINTLINQHVASVASEPTRPLHLLDAGCGEGYYTNALAQSFSQTEQAPHITGIDISKFAVKAAAGLNKQATWFVANSSQLPVADHSCDCILTLFSPIPKPEFIRALSPTGYLLIASTGAQHLIELREKLYEEVKVDALNPLADLTSEFSVSEQQVIRFPLALTSQQDICDLLAMTPHYWRASPDKKQQLEQLEALTVTVDINIFLLKIKPSC